MSIRKPTLAPVAAAAGADKRGTKPTTRPQLPPELSSVMLIDAPTCAAAGAMSVSWWHSEVSAGRAPKPVIQRPRCTRWRLVDVSGYWAQRAEQAAADSQAAANVTARATKASAAAKIKRQQALTGA